MVLMDGKKLAQQLEAELKTQLDNLPPTSRKPSLVVIIVGKDPSSEVYVHHKQQACARVGITSKLLEFPEDVSEATLITTIEELNEDSGVDGILLQFPLPSHLSETKMMSLVTPSKDVDGFNYQNQGLLMQNQPTIFPCTPLGVMELLKAYEIEIKGKNVCVVGTSNIVGKPLGMMLLNQGASVDFCHEFTNDLPSHTRRADILITAVGHQRLITKEMVKSQAVVVDIGITKASDSKKVSGDVDFDQVKTVAGYLTPVPGGIGPMTVAMLLKNTLMLYLTHKKLNKSW